MVESIIAAFLDGIRKLEVRAAVRLDHDVAIKLVLAHNLKVETVRQDIRYTHQLREVSEEVKEDKASFKNRRTFRRSNLKGFEKGELFWLHIGGWVPVMKENPLNYRSSGRIRTR